MDRWYGRLACGAMSSDRAYTLTPKGCARCELCVWMRCGVVGVRAMMDSKKQASDVLMSYHISPFGTEHDCLTAMGTCDANDGCQFRVQTV